MNRFVLDASVSAAWFLPSSNQKEEEFALMVRGRLAAGGCAVVPALWSIEMANVLARAVRKGIIAEREGERAVGQLEILLIPSPARIEIQTPPPPVWQIYGTARKFNVSGYDGVYLTLAKDEDLPLATLDKDLQSAASKAGVRLLTV